MYRSSIQALILGSAIVGTASATQSPTVTVDRALQHHPHSVLIKIKPGTGLAKGSDVAKAFQADKAENFGQGMEHWWQLTLPNHKSSTSVVKALSKNPHVEHAQLNYEIQLHQSPNDFHYDELWGLHNTGQTGGTIDADIDAEEAWNKHTGSRDVIVAVIDTGVDYTVADLQDNMWHNPGEIPNNGFDDDGNGLIDDIHGAKFLWGYSDSGDPMDDVGHGTHVAGTIAAVGNNSEGITGVAWSTQIMALKFFRPNGFAYLSDAVKAINYARINGADIMNNSWGGPAWLGVALEDAVRLANEAGVLVVASAGNSSIDIDNRAPSERPYPATIDEPNVISVAASDHNDALAPFSNYGLIHVDLAAPGVSILSTLPTAIPCTYCGEEYAAFSGTSMAAPHVSGAAALLWSRFPHLSVTQLKARLLDTVDPVPALLNQIVTGGRLNANAALSMVGFDTVVSPHQQPIIHGEFGQFTLHVTNTETFEQTLSLSLSPTPAGLSASLSVNSVTLAAGESTEINLMVETTTNMERGIYPVKVAISDGTTTAISEAQIDITVPGTEIIGSGEVHILGIGGSTDVNLRVKSVDGYAGPVVMAGNPQDPEVTISVSPSNFTLPVDGFIDVVATISASTAAQPQFMVNEVTAQAETAIATSYLNTDVQQVNVCPSGCPFTSIQAAIDAAESGDVVIVGAGTYYETIIVNKYMTLMSASGAEVTIITPPEGVTGSVVTLQASQAIFEGFTVTGGYTEGTGGGISILSSLVQVQHNIIANNHAVGGGGGLYTNTRPTVSYNIIRNNTSGASPTDNLSSDSGGIYSIHKSGFYIGNIIENNEGTGMRSAAWYAAQTIENNTFRGNTWAGLYFPNYTNNKIRNNLFIENHVGVHGGQYGGQRIINNTFVGNTHVFIAGAIAFYNNIFWQNANPNTSHYRNGNFTGDPLFVGNGDYRLSEHSPAIDVGVDTAPYGVTQDFDGVDRPQDGDGLGAGGTGDGSDYDAGAFEFRHILQMLPYDVCPSGCPFGSIQAAIDAAVVGDVITVGPGTYYETVWLNKYLTLKSALGAEVTTITPPAGTNGSVVTVQASEAIFEGFTITGGYTDGTGGGISILSNRSEIRHNIITGNHAVGGGGGIYTPTWPTVTDNIITNNTSGIDANDHLASDSGGIYSIYKSGTYTGNIIENNEGAGMRMASRYSALVIEGNTFRNNSRTGIYFPDYTNSHVRNNLFIDNYIGIESGRYGNQKAVNNTFVGNQYAFNGASLQFYNSIFFQNTNLNLSWGGALVAGNLRDIDPLFIGNGNYRLTENSPAIDTGVDTSSYGVISDFDETPRPQDGDGLGAITGDGSDYDIGAFEY